MLTETIQVERSSDLKCQSDQCDSLSLWLINHIGDAATPLGERQKKKIGLSRRKIWDMKVYPWDGASGSSCHSPVKWVFFMWFNLEDRMSGDEGDETAQNPQLHLCFQFSGVWVHPEKKQVWWIKPDSKSTYWPSVITSLFILEDEKVCSHQCLKEWKSASNTAFYSWSSGISKHSVPLCSVTGIELLIEYFTLSLMHLPNFFFFFFTI